MRSILYAAAILFIGPLIATAKADGPIVLFEGGHSWSEDADVANIDREIAGGMLPNFIYNLDDDLGTFGMVGGLIGYEVTGPKTFDGRLRIGGLINARMGGEYDPGFSYNAEVYGYDINANGAKANDISSISGKLALEYDFLQFAYNGAGWKAYLTGGVAVGGARNMIDDQRFNASLTVSDGEESETASLSCSAPDVANGSFAWSGQGGIGADFGENVTAQVLYRYADLGHVKTAEKYTCGADVFGYEKTFAVNKPEKELDLIVHEIVARVGVRW